MPPDAFALIEALQRHGAAIAVGMALDDVLVTSIAAMRARVGLRALVALDAELPADLRAAMHVAVDDHERSFAAQPVIASLQDSARLMGWLARSRPTEIDVFEAWVRNRPLGALDFSGLRIVASTFTGVGLAGSIFDDATIEDCDFTTSDLACTSWTRARVTRCRFTGASFVDSTLDEARFVDCSFRGVDLGAAKYGPRVTARHTQLVRADLRETGWQRRILAGTKFDACAFSGIHGRPVVDGVEIEAPDLSLAADGGRIGTAEDILARWREAPRPSREPPDPLRRP